MFESEKEIEKYCYDNGIFIVRNNNEVKLARKTSNDDFTIYSDVKMKDGSVITALGNFIDKIYYNTINPSIEYGSIKFTIPSINLQVFNDYDHRQSDIDNHKIIVKDLSESKFKLFGRNTNLIYGVKYMLDTSTGGYNNIKSYFNIIDGSLVPIDSRQLSDKEKAKAIEVRNISSIETALADNLENEFSEKYNRECRNWDWLKAQPSNRI